ncbi:hypothetical protein PIROE2DRAFT_11578 [Piromyces sp. E2]|nr:hypothetical protein PIROE2DRAFT_11578 [Piromyces sp. E2]|eukprot:OUM62211.1 hypothetical protein PIROE2DRAFT_11578 [Piromyces sp. E2]
MYNIYIIKSKNIILENDNDVITTIQYALNSNDNDEINFLFTKPSYNLNSDIIITQNIKTNVSFIGNTENNIGKTVINLSEYTVSSPFIFEFIDETVHTIKFKNFIIQNYNSQGSFALFNIERNENEYDYQLLFENCIFDNNNSILKINTFCGKNNKQKQISFNNCIFKNNHNIEKHICYNIEIKNSTFNNFENVASINYGNVILENNLFVNSIITKEREQTDLGMETPLILTSLQPTNNIYINNCNFTKLNTFSLPLFKINSSQLE